MGNQYHKAVLQQTTEAVLKQETANSSVYRTEGVVQEVDICLSVDSPEMKKSVNIYTVYMYTYFMCIFTYAWLWSLNCIHTYVPANFHADMHTLL